MTASLLATHAAEVAGQGMDPYLSRLLRGLGLDVAFVRGAGTLLYDAEGRGYLDFAGAYGALPFGHNPPAIWDAIEAVRHSGEPSLTQPSAPVAAAELSARLSALTSLPHAFLANSGAEAVEAAIKLTRAATGRHLIVSTEGAFHGKTLGALSATGRPGYQRPFGAPAAGFETVPYGSAGALRAVFAERGERIAAFMVEPVQGEGGIIPAPDGYLPLARRLCSRYGVKLVLDEVQTGLGRTGRMFAAEHHGVVPDVMTLAKALGGGIVPAAATLYGADCLTEDFSLRHSSTFGGNAFCARVGLATLGLLTADGSGLVRAAARAGERLCAGLTALAASYPAVVSGVRGRGLLLGIQVSGDPSGYPQQGMFRSLAHAGGLAAFLCGYLLREEGIRVAPAYFATDVLRVEPPLTVTDRECGDFLAGLDRALALVASGRSGQFFAHMVPGRTVAHAPVTAPVTPVPGARAAAKAPPCPVPRPGEPRWAFIGHPTTPESYRSFDPALGLPAEQVRALFARMEWARSPDTPASLFVGGCRVTAADGRSSYGEMFALPHDAATLLDLPTRAAADLIAQAVAEAAARGAQVVGLGAYTSIVTGNGTLLGPTGVPVTTGNAYTAASALSGLAQVAARRGIEMATARVTLLGATGSIGRVMAILLAREAGGLVLAGNPRGGEQASRRLTALASEIAASLLSPPADPGAEPGALALAVAADAAGPGLAGRLAAAGLLRTTLAPGPALATADLVVAATSSPDLLIRPDGPRHGAIICDVSQPPNTDPRLAAARPDLTVFSGGLVELPGRRDLGVAMGLPAGVSYACAAETMIIASLPAPPPVSFGGLLHPELVARLRAEGERLGFRLHLPDHRPEGGTP